MGDVRKVVVLADIHTPYQHEPSLKALEAFIPDYKPDVVVILGDLLDFPSVSTWDEGTVRMEGQRIRDDLIAGNEMLDRIEGWWKWKEKFFFEGNHEERLQRHLDRNPKLIGLVNVFRDLNLKDRGFKVVPIERKGERIGKLRFHHGWKTSKYHTGQYTADTGRNYMVGHLHTMQVYTHKSPTDEQNHACFSIPCLCDLNPDYMEGRPSSWIHGCALVEVMDGEQGRFTPYPIPFNSTKNSAMFSWNGRIYRG